MRLKTYLATYLLFLLILFGSIGIVSTYLSNSQVTMLKNKSEGQFESITRSLYRDVTALYAREQHRPDIFQSSVISLVQSYAHYYRRHNVSLFVEHLVVPLNRREDRGLVFIQDLAGRYVIRATGFLPAPFDEFLLGYTLDVTENIQEMRDVQSVLLFSAIMFSALAAVALYMILSSIFKPLQIVAETSREIAGGNFDRRIEIKGKNELAQMGADFNKMADQIQVQILSLEEEAENKQQFVDNFAHEIRTPLTSIYGYAELLQKAALNEEEIIESATYIMEESRHMRNIANSLLELATLRDYVPEMAEINIANLFEDILQSVKIHYSNDFDDNTICGQEDLVKALLLNLCNNAKKAYEGVDGLVKLAAEREDGGIKITVTDYGCGIPRDQLQKIFEPFYRLDTARNRVLAGGGVGLGLTLCKRIVDVHGAKMQIESEPGKGTTVEVLFN